MTQKWVCTITPTDAIVRDWELLQTTYRMAMDELVRIAGQEPDLWDEEVETCIGWCHWRDENITETHHHINVFGEVVKQAGAA